MTRCGIALQPLRWRQYSVVSLRTDAQDTPQHRLSASSAGAPLAVGRRTRRRRRVIGSRSGRGRRAARRGGSPGADAAGLLRDGPDASDADGDWATPAAGSAERLTYRASDCIVHIFVTATDPARCVRLSLQLASGSQVALQCEWREQQRGWHLLAIGCRVQLQLPAAACRAVCFAPGRPAPGCLLALS